MLADNSLPDVSPPPVGAGDYLTGALILQSSLEEAISLLIQRKGITNDPKEMSELKIGIPRLRAMLSTVNADLAAYLANQIQILPPTADVLKTIRTIATQIDGMVAASDQAKVILSFATNAAATWNTATKPA
jgi:hypothetical protein